MDKQEIAKTAETIKGRQENLLPPYFYASIPRTVPDLFPPVP